MHRVTLTLTELELVRVVAALRVTVWLLGSDILGEYAPIRRVTCEAVVTADAAGVDELDELAERLELAR